MFYDPTNSQHRALLGQGLLTMLARKGLARVFLNGCREATFDLEVEKHLNVRVYTSVENGETRLIGSDAIRVCLVYTDSQGRRKSLGNETRVHRTGDVNLILARLAERIRSAEQRAKVLLRCQKCGAPMAVSKAGSLYCADVCWNR